MHRTLKRVFRYVDYPFLISYRGFGNAQTLILQGHVFRGMAMLSFNTKRKSLKNLIQLIKMFLVRTVGKATIEMHLKGETYAQHTNAQGFFEFNIANHGLAEGWYEVLVKLKSKLVEGQETVEVKAHLLIARQPKRVVVSDIDDTLLVSHITKLWRKIYLLVSRNPQSRKPFKGVVQLYQKLHAEQNPVFYVSSSEWNLYEFLRAFMQFHKLPKGVLQLKDLKSSWRHFFSKRRNGHHHKREKIERLLALYPQSKFVLLGDNGQQDPYIYKHLAEKYPHQIRIVLIREINSRKAPGTKKLLATLKQKNIPYCVFKNSAAAEDFCKKEELF
jgi:phosphatidate phosphatase APP1